MNDDAEQPMAAGGHGFQGHHRLGSKIALTIGSQGVGTLFGYAALLAIGRYYAPQAYGAYLFALSLIGLMGTLFRLGFTQAHQREVGGGLAINRALGVYARIRLVLTALLVTLVLLGLWIWFGLLGRDFTDATTLQVILVMLASTAVAAPRLIATETWVAQGRVHRAEWCNTIDSLVYAGTVVLLGLGLAHARGRWTPADALGGWVDGLLHLPAAPGVGQLALLIAAGHLLGKIAGLALAGIWWFKDRTRVGPWEPALAREYRDFALPVALTGVLALVLQHTDVLMIGYFWTAREVGWYGAAQRLANVALLANIAIRGILMPFFSSLHRRGEHERAMAVFRQIERFLLVAVLPLAIAMMIWAEAGIHIFVGDGFLGGAGALRWLAAWTIVSAMGLPVRAQHMASGNTQILVRAVGINVAVNVVLNLTLIPPQLFGLGAEGAAIATFFSSLTAYAYSRYHAAAKHGIPWLDWAQLRMFGAALVPAVIWWSMHARLPEAAYDRVWELVGIGLIGAIAYVIALIITRGLRRTDIGLLRNAMGPRRLWGELRGR